METLTEDEFAELFRRDYRRLVGVARRVLGDVDEAEDAAQEAFVALRADAVQSKSADDIAAWLSRVATNRALNRLRGRRRADVREQVVAGRSVAAPVDELERAAIGFEDRERVRDCLAVLPDRQATVLLLRHSGYTYREVAASLGIAEGSVGVLLARAERAFRRAYEEMSE